MSCRPHSLLSHAHEPPYAPDDAVVELDGARVREARVQQGGPGPGLVEGVVGPPALHVHIHVEAPEAVQDLVVVEEGRV